MKNIAFCLLGFLLTSACTLAPPFKRSEALKRTAASDATAIIALTHATLGQDSQKNEIFWEYIDKILDTLAQQPGYLGHGVRIKLLGGEAWTMTAWEDQKSVNDFVNTPLHRTAVRSGYPALADERFAQITVKRSEVPISWKRADALLRDRGRKSE